MKRSLLVLFIIFSIIVTHTVLYSDKVAIPFMGNEEQSGDSGVGVFPADSRLEKVLNWPVELFSGIGGAASGSAVIEELAAEITYGLDNDYERLVAVYDWVTHNIAYDLAKADNIRAYGSGALYLIEERQGVCHDYAELTLALLTAAGIEATYESGEVLNSSDEIELHAWNRALADDRMYGLDTTWGAGFPDLESSGFIQKPRRIYLTSPEELYNLHQDPEYRKEVEHSYMLKRSLEATAYYMPGYEEKLLDLFNNYRSDKGLSYLAHEDRLVDLARQSAADAAEKICNNREYTLDQLSEQLTARSSELGMKTGAISSLSIWSYQIPTTDDIFLRFLDDHSGPVDEPDWHSVAVSVIRRGDLVVSVFIFLEY